MTAIKHNYLFAMLLLVACSASASTGSLSGVIQAKHGKGADNDFSPADKKGGVYGSLVIESTFLWYVSKGGFHLSGGDTAGQVGKVFGGMAGVRTPGTYTLLNGEPIHPGGFWKACKPGRWGSFYESTYHAVNTFPMPQNGTFEQYDADTRTIAIKQYYADCGRHTSYNPPKTNEYKLDADAQFQLDDKVVSAKEALKPKSWLHIYPARKQIVDLRTSAVKVTAKELYDPAKHNGKVSRGNANILCGPGVFTQELDDGWRHGGWTMDVVKAWPRRGAEKEKDAFRMKLDRQFYNKDEWEEWTFGQSAYAKMSLLLDGLWADPSAAYKPGRRVIAWHYRDVYTSKVQPSFFLVIPDDDRVRGIVKAVDGKTLTIEKLGHKDEPLGEITVEVAADAEILLDGADVDAGSLSKAVGATLILFPQRPQTVMSFPRNYDWGGIPDLYNSPGVRMHNLFTMIVKSKREKKPLPAKLVEQLIVDPEASIALVEKRISELNPNRREYKDHKFQCEVALKILRGEIPPGAVIE